MFKILPVALVAATILVATVDQSKTTLAGTCASNCGEKALQFTPGQRVRVEVVNNTPNLVELEKLQGTTPILLRPKQKLQLEQRDTTEPNISLVFWEKEGRSLQAIVSKPNIGTLRVELRPTWRVPGDRSVYILDDGRVNIL
ncbi:hypothetical protein [Nostoc sp. TCL26-01]|uniref:hypothetical protein n=1 Tax=Nostoc sp. TCL26-01 TaxID=2576904 RepID=UPI0015BAB987|nr:hypothetical protein [Nostoc sp. TCL26-01]QLE56979.1 hypothetical protein FD725_16515 [Nostoc sp. TCL26-01]